MNSKDKKIILEEFNLLTTAFENVNRLISEFLIKHEIDICNNNLKELRESFIILVGRDPIDESNLEHLKGLYKVL